MKIAIYEPDPRICGPDSWASYVRSGFRGIGCECDVVTFNKTGKARAKWGRVQRETGLVSSCTLVPDRVGRIDLAEEVLDEYDLVVLTDVKCPSQDKKATDDFDPWPTYVECLLHTKTPWTSALHGRLYYAEHEYEEHEELRSSGGKNAALRGSPFIGELTSLKNFSGFLLDHCVDDRFVTWCEVLRNAERVHLPLPYVLRYDDGDVRRFRRQTNPESRWVGTIGRMTQIKFRHLLNEMVYRDLWPWPTANLVYGGATSVTYGPSESFELYEQIMGRPDDERNPPSDEWVGTREGGVRSNTVWRAEREYPPAVVEYRGAYEHPMEVAGDIDIHVGITDHVFSGGLCEFSTMEAIDCGCFPVISEPFDAGLGLEQVVIPRAYHGVGLSAMITSRRKPEKYPDVPTMFQELRDALLAAGAARSEETVRHNRTVLAERCDPRIHARAFLEGVGLT